MRKQVKLNIKKDETREKKQNSGFFFFVEQGRGAGRIAVNVLKVLELIVTSIFAFTLGIFAPLCIWNGEQVEPELTADPSVLWWMLSSIVYIIGLFMVMLGHSKTATVIHIIAAGGTFVTYSFFTELYKNAETTGPTMLYMPCLFITMLTIGIMLIINVPIWIDKRIEKENATAPSIFDDKDEREI